MLLLLKMIDSFENINFVCQGWYRFVVLRQF